MKQDALYYFLQALGTLFRVRRIYPPGKRQVHQAARQAAQRLADWGHSVRITLLGEDAIVEDRKLEGFHPSFRGLFQSLGQSGCESVQVEADANENDLIAWIEHVISKERRSYRSSKIVAGSLNLETHSDHSPSALTQAVAGYLEFLSQAQEALSDLESKKAEGLMRAREIVSAIAARLTIGKELFEPIRKLKDYDDYTFTHALNVCVISSALARTLRVTQDFVDAISLAALCHDLGKKQVPKEILNKGGPLEPEERACVENHPTFGAQLLYDIPGVVSENPLLPVVAYQHHIGANQSGYPKPPVCLGAHRLHYASLLVAVADVFDALRTVRPYRPALNIAKVSTILLKEMISGKLHKEYVSALFMLLKVLVPGRKVVLSNRKQGVIVETYPSNALTPIVESEDGEVFDLSVPSSPNLFEVVEEDPLKQLEGRKLLETN